MMSKKRYKGIECIRKEVMRMRCQGTLAIKGGSEDMKKEEDS